MSDLEKSRIDKIKTLHQEIAGHLKLSLEKAIKIGELLTEQKTSLKHGGFTTWINANMPFTDRTARNYMRLYRGRDELKTETISDLKTAYGFLRQSDESELDLKFKIAGLKAKEIMKNMEASEENIKILKWFKDECFKLTQGFCEVVILHEALLGRLIKSNEYN